MKFTFYDIFRYLRQVLDGDHQSELTLFVVAFILQRLQNYTFRFPESLSFSMTFYSDDNAVDFFVIRRFLKAFIDVKCREFCPQSLMLSIHFLDAFILFQFGENLSESSFLDVKNN